MVDSLGKMIPAEFEVDQHDDLDDNSTLCDAFPPDREDYEEAYHDDPPRVTQWFNFSVSSPEKVEYD